MAVPESALLGLVIKGRGLFEDACRLSVGLDGLEVTGRAGGGMRSIGGRGWSGAKVFGSGSGVLSRSFLRYVSGEFELDRPRNLEMLVFSLRLGRLRLCAIVLLLLGAAARASSF